MGLLLIQDGQRPMIRAYNAIIAAVVNTITYSIVLFG
jgi:hypothetical protein